MLGRRRKLCLFLASVFLVRWIHWSLLGSPLIGMNFRVVSNVKRFLACGFGYGAFDVPPGPQLLIAALAKATGSEPRQLLGVVLLGLHLVLAIGFWRWIGSIGPNMAVRPEETSSNNRVVKSVCFLIFVFLPALNSYEGFDNIESLFAASIALNLIASIQNLQSGVAFSEGSHKSYCRVLPQASIIGIQAAAVILCRSEYLVLIPTYLVLMWGFHRALYRTDSDSRRLASIVATSVGLMIGSVALMTIRLLDVGEFSLGSGPYACHTFLDGIPERWQRPTDKTEVDRVETAMTIFGDPKVYDFSLPRMIASHPWLTAQKVFFNVFRWSYELGRRHVVVPVALSSFAVIGLLVLLRDPGQAGWRRESLPEIASTLLMTIPLTLLIPTAEYLMASYSPICMLAAVGTVSLLQWIRQFLPARLNWLANPIGAQVMMAIVLEAFLLRGGGTFSDAPQPPLDMARAIDRQMTELNSDRVILDPMSIEIDCCCKTTVLNAIVLSRLRMSQREEALPDLVASEEFSKAMTTIPSTSTKMNRKIFVVVWSNSDSSPTSTDAKVKSWISTGFTQVAATSERLIFLAR